MIMPDEWGPKEAQSMVNEITKMNVDTAQRIKGLFKKPLILVVEDEPSQRVLIREILEKGGYSNIECVGDLESSRKAVEREVPKCVVLDIRLGGENGTQLIDDLPEGVKVIILSGVDPRDLPQVLGSSHKIIARLNKGNGGMSKIVSTIQQALAV